MLVVAGEITTKFEYYRDMVPPVVKVSTDGSLGWVIVQVEAKGVRAGEAYAFQSAWIELYEKQDGFWLTLNELAYCDDRLPPRIDLSARSR